MGKVIKLTESDILKIYQRIILEDFKEIVDSEDYHSYFYSNVEVPFTLLELRKLSVFFGDPRFMKSNTRSIHFKTNKKSPLSDLGVVYDIIIKKMMLPDDKSLSYYLSINSVETNKERVGNTDIHEEIKIPNKYISTTLIDILNEIKEVLGIVNSVNMGIVNETDYIPGGLAKGKSLMDIAVIHSKKKNVSKDRMYSYLKKQLNKGINVESEHTTNVNFAKEIVMDHLLENPTYYKELEKIEEQSLNEMIKLDIKVGDVVMGGKFKNKKITVKTIDKNEKGDITINGKPLLRFRVIDK